LQRGVVDLDGVALPELAFELSLRFAQALLHDRHANCPLRLGVGTGARVALAGQAHDVKLGSVAHELRVHAAQLVDLEQRLPHRLGDCGIGPARLTGSRDDTDVSRELCRCQRALGSGRVS
jgi:hypothetical protein